LMAAAQVMKALILVGGYGTRLRPLTFSLPKPLVPFANESIVVHQIEALVKVGVREIILAVNYQPEAMVKYLADCEAKYGIKIIMSQENEPMGTAGPLALARAHLETASNFFVLNSDVICEFPLQDMLDFHNAHGHEGTIMVTQVKDPSKYGVVVFQEGGTQQINRFVEKPVEFVGDKINAGIYVFKPDILKRIELKPTSIERETFPAMAADSNLHAFVLPGYWMDIGQPKDFLTGMVLHLGFLRRSSPAALAAGANIRGNVLIHPSAQVSPDAVLGPDVVVGPNVVIGAGARIQRSTLMDGARVKEHAWVNSTIVGWESTVGKWTRVEANTVLGKDVQLGDEIYINGAIVCPHKAIKENITQAGSIVM